MTVLRVPPGRGGRTWLAARLAAAQRGADVLDTKLAMLRQEQQRRRGAAERAEQSWAERCRSAEGWLLRAAMLGGEQALRLAEPDGDATVEVSWAAAMGVRYPGTISCTLPPSGGAVIGSTALLHAQAEFAAAIESAAACAAAREASRRIDAAVTATRGRSRALRHRLIPELQLQLQLREAELEEIEREDAVRLRWAANLQSR